MYLKVDPSNGTPIYLQIIEQIKHAISIGIFKEGEPIPTIRDIALELRVNPNTVAKSIRELERDGILKTFVGKGSFVTENSHLIARAEFKEKAETLTFSYVKDMRWLGLKKKEVSTLVDEQWEKTGKEYSKHEQ